MQNDRPHVDVYISTSFSFSKGIFLEPLDAESIMKKILRKMKQPRSVDEIPANYATLCYFLKFSGVAALFGT